MTKHASSRLQASTSVLALLDDSLWQKLDAITRDVDSWPLITRDKNSSRVHIIHEQVCATCATKKHERRGIDLYAFHLRLKADIAKLSYEEATEYIQIIQDRLPSKIRLAYIYAVSKSKAIQTQTQKEWNSKYKSFFLKDKHLYCAIVGEAIIAAHYKSLTEK